jgi:hypothetical protein
MLVVSYQIKHEVVLEFSPQDEDIVTKDIGIQSALQSRPSQASTRDHNTASVPLDNFQCLLMPVVSQMLKLVGD